MTKKEIQIGIQANYGGTNIPFLKKDAKCSICKTSIEGGSVKNLDCMYGKCVKKVVCKSCADKIIGPYLLAMLRTYMLLGGVF